MAVFYGRILISVTNCWRLGGVSWISWRWCSLFYLKRFYGTKFATMCIWYDLKRFRGTKFCDGCRPGPADRYAPLGLSFPPLRGGPLLMKPRTATPFRKPRPAVLTVISFTYWNGISVCPVTEYATCPEKGGALITSGLFWLKRFRRTKFFSQDNCKGSQCENSRITITQRHAQILRRLICFFRPSW